VASVTSTSQSRREKHRAQTIDEIKAAARDLLIEAGPSGISLRAIARKMGMSAPGLYRYFPSLEALITELCADLYQELGAAMSQACQEFPDTILTARLPAAARAFRGWAVSHRAEFTLMFASLAPGTVMSSACVVRPLDPDQEPYKSMLSFSRVFGTMFHQLYHQSDAERGFALRTPAIPPLSPQLREEIQRCAGAIGADVPIEFAYIFHSFWIRLYGLVTMEVFGQLPVIEQTEALLEAEIFAMADQLGIRPS
jgi:AcrR family transcriptional regulator